MDPHAHHLRNTRLLASETNPAFRNSRDSTEHDYTSDASDASSAMGTQNSQNQKKVIKKLKFQLIMPLQLAEWLRDWNIINNSHFVEVENAISTEYLAVLNHKASYSMVCGFGIMMVLTRAAHETGISAFRTANKFPENMNKYSPKFRSLMWQNIEKDLRIGFRILITSIDKQTLLSNDAKHTTKISKIIVNILLQIQKIYYQKMKQFKEIQKIVLSMVHGLVLLKTRQAIANKKTSIQNEYDETSFLETEQTSRSLTMSDSHETKKKRQREEISETETETLATNVSAMEIFQARELRRQAEQGMLTQLWNALVNLLQKLGVWSPRNDKHEKKPRIVEVQQQDTRNRKIQNTDEIRRKSTAVRKSTSKETKFKKPNSRSRTTKSRKVAPLPNTTVTGKSKINVGQTVVEKDDRDAVIAKRHSKQNSELKDTPEATVDTVESSVYNADTFDM